MSPHTRKTLGRFTAAVLFILALVAAFKALLVLGATHGAEPVLATVLVFVVALFVCLSL